MCIHKCTHVCIYILIHCGIHSFTDGLPFFPHHFILFYPATPQSYLNPTFHLHPDSHRNRMGKGWDHACRLIVPHFAVQIGLEFLIFLPPPPKDWDYRGIPPCSPRYRRLFRKYICMYIWVSGRYACEPRCPGGWKCQIPPELVFQVFTSHTWTLGTQLGSSAKAMYTLNH